MENNYQMTMFDYIYSRKEYKIEKPIRLIELFAGYGSQHFALEYLGANFESWKICEWAVKSIQAYKDAHFPNDNQDYSQGLSRDEIEQFLFEKGISANYNEPMSLEQIKRLGEEKQRTIFNNIKATHNLVSVVNCKAKDLEIVDRDKYTYLMTYSFPCQDLSKAGKMAGMSKDSSTRSGMLWQVERILEECGQDLPHILLMENVPDVIGEKNKLDFAKWYQKLEQLGYANFYEVLNAKDYGIPQNRERCFMVSILGDFYYNFPSKMKLQKRLKDLLEKNVDESFFLSDEKITQISNWKAQQDPLKDIDKEKPICPTLTARGGGNEHSGMVLINEKLYNNQALNETLKENIVEDSDFIDTYNKCVKKDIAGTITTRVSGANRTFVAQDTKSIPLKRGYSVDVKEEKQDSDKVDVIGNYSKKVFNQTSIVGKNGLAPTVCENHGQVTGIVVPSSNGGGTIPIKNATKRGYL